MADSHPTNQTNRDATSSRGGWTPSRGFWIGMGGVVAFALMLTAAGAIAAGREQEPVAVSEATPLPEPVQVTVIPRKTTPPDGVTRDLGAPAGANEIAVDQLSLAVAVTSATTESPVTVASSWSMDPVTDGTAASSTSITPERVTSSAMVAALGR